MLSLALVLAVAALWGFYALSPVNAAPNSTSPSPPPLDIQEIPPPSGFYSLYSSLRPEDVPTATYEWLEIRDTADFEWNLGGRGGGDWDVSRNYQIGFYFPFYEDLYTQFRVSEKGYIFFPKPGVDIGTGRGRPGLIPSNALTGTDDAINNFIAPFADDLFGNPDISRVYVRHDSNPRRTIIEFENMVWCCGRNNPRTFQIILYPNGDIKMQYLKVTNFAGSLDEGLNRVVIVGLENLDGSAGDVYTQGTFLPEVAATWQDEMALRFAYHISGTQAMFIPPERTIWDDPGRKITTTSELYLGAADYVSRSFFLTHTVAVSSNLSISDWLKDLSYPATIGALTGTYSSTQQFVVSIPASVTNIYDMATVTFTAISTDATPYLSATFKLTYGPAHRDLQIAKRLDPDIPPAEGGALRYHLLITNTDQGDSDRAAVAHNVVVTDLLPAGVTYEDCHRSDPWWHRCGSAIQTSEQNSQTLLTLDLGNLHINEVESIWLEVRNHNSTGEILSNMAHVTTTEDIELGYGPNNHAGVTCTVALSATELHLDKDYPHNNNYVAVSQTIPYNIHVYNNGRNNHTGNTPLYNATIVDQLPEGTSFDHAELYYAGPELITDTEGPITPSILGHLHNTLVFTLPFVDNGDWNYATLRLWVNVPPTIPLYTYLTNTATIYHGSESDSDSERIRVVSQYVDPFVEKEASLDDDGNAIPAGPGQDYTFWVHYGTRSIHRRAEGIIITDTLPYSVSLVSVSAAPYLQDSITRTLSDGRVQIIWHQDTIQLNTNRTIWDAIPTDWRGQIAVVVRVDENVPPATQLVNQAVLTYTGDYDPAISTDDTAYVTVEVNSDLYGSQKLVDNPTPRANNAVWYTLLISNTNPTAALPFTVSDTLPEGVLTYITHQSPTTGQVITDDGRLLWTGGTVGPNSTVTLTFQALVTRTATPGQIIHNTFTLTGGNLVIKRGVDITIAPDLLVYLPLVLRQP